MWTDSEISYLKEMWGKKSAAKIGAEINKTKGQVIYRAQVLKLPKITKNEISRLMEIGRGFTAPKFQKINIIPKKVTKKKLNILPLSNGRCQWIKGDTVPLRTTDEGKCLKPTVYRKCGKRSPYCLEHTERAWDDRPQKRLNFKGID